MFDAVQLIRAHVHRMQPYEPVLPFGVLSRQLGLPAEALIKLDANENPYGPLPAVAEALASLGDVHIYPDPGSRDLRQALATFHGVPVENLLAGAGAECVLNGLFTAIGSQHVDNQTTIDHAEPHGTSRELYKGVLGGRSKGVFNGKIIVRPDAQKTDAQQSNPNLLLSDGAEVNTRPNLEIFADDVKCKHGSTVGRLDEDALFFLRSRGIGVDEARQMLARAFASEVVDQIPSPPLREEITRCVFEKVRFDEGAAE